MPYSGPIVAVIDRRSGILSTLYNSQQQRITPLSSSLSLLESASFLYCGPEQHEYAAYGAGSTEKAVQRRACGYCGRKAIKYCLTSNEKGRVKIGMCVRKSGTSRGP